MDSNANATDAYAISKPGCSVRTYGTTEQPMTTTASLPNFPISTLRAVLV